MRVEPDLGVSGPPVLGLPRPVAFVLGGGAAFGAVQVGMLQALQEAGLRPDLVVGTSVGSINGALLAEDPDAAASRLTYLWLGATRELVFPGRAVDHLRTWREHHTYLVPSDALRTLLTATLTATTVEQLPIPFAATTMDLLTGQAVHLEAGPLVPALLASAAVPGLYPPVPIGGRDLVDGGVVSNVSVKHALAMGARSIVVLDCGVFGLRPEAPRSLPETVAHVAAIMMRQQLAHDLPEVARDVPVLYMPGPFPLLSSPLEFDASATLIRDACHSGRAFLAALTVDGPGLYGDAPLITA